MVVQMDGFRKSYLLQQRLSQITGIIEKVQFSILSKKIHKPTSSHPYSRNLC